MATRDYPVEGLTVHWDSDVCVHSRVCATTLPQVFRPDQRPWIDAGAAPADDLAGTIDLCPSGALRYTRTAAAHDAQAQVDAGVADALAEAGSEPAPPSSVTVTATANGPLEILGPVTVLSADGTVLREGSRMYLCRCGHSARKPFCDGSHSRLGFSDAAPAPDEVVPG